MGKGKKRRTAAEKLRIVLLGSQPDVEISDLCRREGLNPSQFYAWKKRLQAGAAEIFTERKPDADQERLAAENQRLKNVIAEITAENLELKKGLLD